MPQCIVVTVLLYIILCVSTTMVISLLLYFSYMLPTKELSQGNTETVWETYVLLAVSQCVSDLVCYQSAHSIVR